MKKTIIRTLFNLIIFFIFFLGGLGNLYSIEIAGLVIIQLLILTEINTKKDYKFPNYSLVYLFFISFQLLSLIWSKNIVNSLEYIVLFASSYGFWIFFYNADSEYKKYLLRIIPILGILFLGLYVFTSLIRFQPLLNLIPKNNCTLFSPYTKEHNHLGDFWALIVLIYTIKLFGNYNLRYLIWISFGFFVLVFSRSRSAILGIIVSLFFYLKDKFFNKEKRFLLFIILPLIIIITYLVSTDKGTILSRPYFIQGIISLINNPIGIGMGNFSYISKNIGTLNIFNSSAAKAHNIILETSSGLGILSIPFILFITLILKNILNKKYYSTSLLLFIIITVNFFFDVTYAIPTMIWLWFSLLGIFQSENKSSL